MKKLFAGGVFPLLIPILPTYGFIRCLRIAFQTCARIFLIITWQPCAAFPFMPSGSTYLKAGVNGNWKPYLNYKKKSMISSF